jgi:hypothetical protein
MKNDELYLTKSVNYAGENGLRKNAKKVSVIFLLNFPFSNEKPLIFLPTDNLRRHPMC